MRQRDGLSVWRKRMDMMLLCDSRADPPILPFKIFYAEAFKFIYIVTHLFFILLMLHYNRISTTLSLMYLMRCRNKLENYGKIIINFITKREEILIINI